MEATAVAEKIKPAALAERAAREGWFGAGFARLKTAVAEIAAVKSLQKFGREEEKE